MMMGIPDWRRKTAREAAILLVRAVGSMSKKRHLSRFGHFGRDFKESGGVKGLHPGAFREITQFGRERRGGRPQNQQNAR